MKFEVLNKNQFVLVLFGKFFFKVDLNGQGTICDWFALDGLVLLVFGHFRAFMEVRNNTKVEDIRKILLNTKTFQEYLSIFETKFDIIEHGREADLIFFSVCKCKDH